MQNNAFQPFGPTYLVSNAAVQVLTTNNVQATSYRIRNLETSGQYISWNMAQNTAPGISASAPTTTQASPNTLGIAASAERVFVLPPNAWFIATGRIEVTPGEGI